MKTRQHAKNEKKLKKCFFVFYSYITVKKRKKRGMGISGEYFVNP